MEPPAIVLPGELTAALDGARPGLAAEMKARLEGLRRPCVYFRGKRTGRAPLRRSRLGRLLGMRAAEPVLPPTASKLGGVPYCEEEEEWGEHWLFIGQIDLAEATAKMGPAPHPFRGPRRLEGLLRFDVHLPPPSAPVQDAFRVRYFPHPDASKAVAVHARSLGTHEASLVIEPGWSLPEGMAWAALLPEELREELGEAWGYGDFDWPAAVDRGHEYDHQLLGWRSSGLDEHYGFEPPEGLSDDIADYEMLLRLTFDNEAGLSWGTNWYYLLVPAEDLARGDFRRVVVTGANS